MANKHNLLIAIYLQFEALFKHIVANQNVALFAALREKKLPKYKNKQSLNNYIKTINNENS